MIFGSPKFNQLIWTYFLNINRRHKNRLLYSPEIFVALPGWIYLIWWLQAVQILQWFKRFFAKKVEMHTSYFNNIVCVTENIMNFNGISYKQSISPFLTFTNIVSWVWFNSSSFLVLWDNNYASQIAKVENRHNQFFWQWL